MVKLKTVATTCTCMNIRKASRALTQLYDEALQPSGLLVTQFTVLVALAIKKSATMTDLAKDLGMDRTTLTRNLKPLETQGLVQITPGQDRRTRLIEMTAAGHGALNEALPLWEQVQAQVMAQLGEQWETLLAGLLKSAQLNQQ